jgi:hypothetical protein
MKNMKNKDKLLFCSVMVGIVINLILPIMAKPFATQEEIKPPNGAANLSFKGQIMHMLVHHAQVPLTSSIIIAVIVGLSITLGKKCFKKM